MQASLAFGCLIMFSTTKVGIFSESARGGIKKVKKIKKLGSQ